MAILKKDTRQKINAFLADPRYILLLAFMTAFSFCVRGEMFFYYGVTLLACYICAFGDDLLPLAPLFVFAYLAPAVMNNPGKYLNTIFYGTNMLYFGLLGVIIVGSLIYRVATNCKQFFRMGHRLLPSLLILCGAYLLSGIGSEGYTTIFGKNLVFALCQCAGLLLPYWLLANGVDWKKARKDYLAWIGVAAGCLILFEIFCAYFINHAIQDGVIHRSRVFVGWGMRNNVGCMMAMTIPFTMVLAIQHRKGIYGIVGGAVFLVGTLMTTSRTSFIFGAVGFVSCVVLMFFYTDDRKKKIIAMAVVAVLFMALVALFRKQLYRLFYQSLDDASELVSRYTIYGNGLRTFLDAPLFGGSFYPGKYPAWGWSIDYVRKSLPDRWHNTVIQLLASCGITGLLAYGYHRLQTVKMALQFRTREKKLTAIAVLIMLACSLLDCHFFNLGPTLFYSIILSFLDKQE